MLAEGRTGPIVTSDGAVNPVRIDKTGALATTDGHGRYQEAVLRGNVFCAANQASATFTLFGTTTATGFILSNPSGSGKNLVLLNVNYTKVTAAAAAIENLVLSGAAQNIVTHTTPLTIQSAIIGSGTNSVARADAAATLPAAGTILYTFGSPSVSATATTSIPPITFAEVAGLFVIPPGAFIQLAAGFTNTLAGVAGMVWEELPV